MGKHHTEDYKLSAVKYALRTDNQVETCEVFDCKRASLQRWIETYRETGSPVRTTRRQRTAYKVKKEYVDFLRQELHKKPDIFMDDLKTLLIVKTMSLTPVSREDLRSLKRQKDEEVRIQYINNYVRNIYNSALVNKATTSTDTYYYHTQIF